MGEGVRARVEEWRNDVLDCEYRLVEEACRLSDVKRSRLLEIGCGTRGFLGRRNGRLASFEPRSVGLDLDREALYRNTNVTDRICASCYSLPLASESVDVIVCRWVMEHLENPPAAMHEFWRVLRGGGVLYIKTPNRWNYAMLLSWLTPTAFHQWIVKANTKNEAFPTFYRANTKRRLTSLAMISGFAVQAMELHAGAYNYFAFNRLLFFAMRSLSQLANGLTDRMQLVLFCVMRKTEGSERFGPRTRMPMRSAVDVAAAPDGRVG